MQPIQSAQPAKTVSAFRIGLLFGIILAVVLILFGIVEQFLPNVAIVFRILSVIIALAAYFFAGFRASAQSGRVRDGLLAGMWTGLISTSLNAVVSIALSIPQLSTLADQANRLIADSGQQTSFHYTGSVVLVAFIIANVLVTIVVSALALGIGALGGAAGKGRAPLPQQIYQESLYQPPMGGYPPSPAQPPYPGYPPQQPPTGNYPPQ